MQKKCLRAVALLLAAVLLLAGPTACGKKGAKLASKGQILVFVAPDDVLPTEIAQARATGALFEDPYALIVQRMSGEELTDTEAFLEKVQLVYEEQAKKGAIHAAVFAPGFAGASDAANWFHTNHPAVRVAVCLPEGRAAGFARTAALVLDFDCNALAKSLVAQSKAMGAKAFYFLTTPRTKIADSAKNLHTALAAECQAQGLRFSDPIVRDSLIDGMEAAQADVVQCASQAAQAVPDGKFAMYSTDRFANEYLAVALLQKKAIIPGLSGGTPLEGIPAALGVEMKNHATDDAYALEQSAKLADKFGTRGKIAVWQASLPSLMLETAVRCVNSLEPEAIPTQEQIEDAFKAAKKSIGSEAAMVQDALQTNLYRFSCELKGL